MDLKAKKAFSSNFCGNVEPNDTLLNVPASLAVHFVENDLCEFVDGGADKDPLAGGPVKPSQSSQAGQASQPNSASTSGENAEQSQSTAPSSESDGPTQSMGATARGGKGTTRKRRSTAKK